MEPFSRFDLGVLQRGCTQCGARLVHAGRKRFDGELPLLLRGNMPVALHGSEFVHLTCPSGCVGHDLLFARDAGGNPHFLDMPYELGSRRHDAAADPMATPTSRDRVVISYEQNGLVKEMIKEHFGPPGTEGPAAMTSAS